MPVHGTSGGRRRHLDLSRDFGKLQLAAYGQAQLTLYQNSHGFRAGSRVFTGVSGGMLVLEKLTASLGLDVLHERPERWQGLVRQDGNLGRTELLAGLTLARVFGETTGALVIPRAGLSPHRPGLGRPRDTLVTGHHQPGPQSDIWRRR